VIYSGFFKTYNTNNKNTLCKYINNFAKKFEFWDVDIWDKTMLGGFFWNATLLKQPY
jgi:hypothetical protein